MKMKFLLMAALVQAMSVSPAFAAAFSFNTATANEMVTACQAEGIALNADVAAAIVQYRSMYGPYASSDDLADVPGVSNELLQQLRPVERNGDLIFDPA